MLVSCVSCQYALSENAVSHRRRSLPAMSFRKEWVFFFSYGCFFLSFRRMRGRFCFLSGRGDQSPRSPLYYGKALCFLLIHSVRVNVVRQSRRFFFVTSGILLLLFPAMITRFHFPISCHDRRASVLKWEHGGGTFLLLFVTVAPFIF